jgi:hypothetical protein
MKKSNIFVLISAGVVVVSMIIVLGTIRGAIGNALATGYSGSQTDGSFSGESISETLDLRNFDQILIEGAWGVKVRQAENFSTEIRYPSSLKDKIDVRVQGRQLILGIRGDSDLPSARSFAEISMPNLVNLQIAGAGAAEFEGFAEQSMDITIDGAARIQGFDSEVNRLNVTLNGLGQIDLGGVVSVDAKVALEGAGEIILRMNGGVLEGSLGGLGGIQYYGSVREERVEVDGLGSVDHHD